MRGFIIILGLIFSRSLYGEDLLNESNREEEWVFVSCAWSPQECYYSCIQRRGIRAEYNPKLCEDHHPGLEWACYCLIE